MKRIVLIFAILLLLSGNVGCQKTPDSDVVVNKNNGELDEAIKKGASELQNIKEQSDEIWTDTIITKSGISVNINAQVEIPDVEKYPVLRMKPTGYNEDQIKYIVTILSNGNTLYQNNTYVVTKEWIDQYIIDAKKQINDLENSDNPNASSQIANLNNSIESLKESYDSALSNNEVNNTEVFINNLPSHLDVMFDLGKETYATFTINDEREDLNRCVLRFYNFGFNGGYTNQKYQDTPPSGMKMTQEYAINLAQETLINLGIKNMSLADILIGSQYNNNTGITDTGKQCYSLYFTHTYNDITTPFWQIMSWKTNASEGSLSEGYRNSWTPEYILIQIDDSGVISFEWFNPIEIIEVETDNVTVITYSEIKDIFKKDINYLISNADLGSSELDKIEISINRIILGMQYIPVGDKRDEYRIIPCWVFMGHDNIFGELNNYIPTSEIILNAIDGSIV